MTRPGKESLIGVKPRISAYQAPRECSRPSRVRQYTSWPILNLCLIIWSYDRGEWMRPDAVERSPPLN